MLDWLKRDHRDAVVDFMCIGPEKVKARYGVPAIPLSWYQSHEQASGLKAIVLKVLGKGIDAYRVASWVRKHDAVIVPGAGSLEGDAAHRAVVLSVRDVPGQRVRESHRDEGGAGQRGGGGARQRLTRLFITTAAKLAFYRSYRDPGSYEAMRQAGVDVTNDHVYPDLAFALRVPPPAGDPLTVGVGIMGFYGGNEDRAQAAEINAAYLEKTKRFVRWLADNGYRIRLFPGDNSWDDAVLEEIVADLRAHRPDSSRCGPSPTP